MKACKGEKAKHNVYKRNYRASNAFEEEKAKHSSYMKHYRNNNDISYAISKFHKMVEQGPL